MDSTLTSSVDPERLQQERPARRAAARGRCPWADRDRPMRRRAGPDPPREPLGARAAGSAAALPLRMPQLLGRRPCPSSRHRPPAARRGTPVSFLSTARPTSVAISLLFRQSSPLGNDDQPRHLLAELRPGDVVDRRDVGALRHDLLDRRIGARAGDALELHLREARRRPGLGRRAGEIGHGDVGRVEVVDAS